LLEYLDAQNRVTTARLQQVLAWSEVLLKEAALKKAAGI
jgi:outer membrane protein TolC